MICNISVWILGCEAPNFVLYLSSSFKFLSICFLPRARAHLHPDFWGMYFQSVLLEYVRARICAHTLAERCTIVFASKNQGLNLTVFFSLPVPGLSVTVKMGISYMGIFWLCFFYFQNPLNGEDSTVNCAT